VNVRPIVIVTLLLAVATLGHSASAGALPDNRAYELVTPLDKNGVEPGDAVSAPDGNSANWAALGGIGDAPWGAYNLYQSRRTDTGWQTTATTPAPVRPLTLFEQQAPMFWSADLSQTVWLTPEPYDPGDNDHGGLDLYLRGPEGKLTWISKGSQGGSEPREVTYEGSSANAQDVVFSTEESLTPNATGLGGGGANYLYVRDLATETTSLIDVDDSGTLLDPEGAILGAGGTRLVGEPPASTFLPADNESGSTTHAISNDGSKIFFESAPTIGSDLTPFAHLYMREDNLRTVAIDDPGSVGRARYEGAAEDGSLVFFTSNEGLGGDPFTDNELYMFNTISDQVTAISAGASGTTDGKLDGVTAIANDGSRVYFIAGGVLAANANDAGEHATEGEPNLYVYDTHDAQTTFVATVDQADIVAPESPRGGPLTVEPDHERLAQPTPDGSMLVFESSTDLTGENPTEFFEVYRYDANNGALNCISCPPNGVTPSGSATIARGGGGTYAPPTGDATMSADGSRIFFATPDPLVPEDTNTEPAQKTLRYLSGLDVYEWENGQQSLITDGRSTTPSFLDGTTPSGNDVFFETDVSLVAQDTDPNFDIYDARVAGGFPAPAPPLPPGCSGAECHASSAQPPAFPPAASTLLQGAENLAPPAASKPKSVVKPKKTPAKKKKSKKKKKKKKKKKAAAKKQRATKRRAGKQRASKTSTQAHKRHSHGKPHGTAKRGRA
jgi:hypothetical protein